MHRAQLLLEDWQYETLKALSEREGKSLSEVLREILTEHFQGDSPSFRRSLEEIEGIGDDPKASGRDHDRVLYGVRHRP